MPVLAALESENVAFVAHIRQIRHHMRHHFEPAVFALLERVADRCDGVPAIGVPRDVLDLAANEAETS